MADLIHTIIDHLTPAMTLAEVEGDAVFVYGVESKLGRPETILDLIDDAYYAFRNRQDSINRLTTCTCRACSAIPTLDLKFITHRGEFVLQSIAGGQKPVGSDVNLAHRLPKNHVAEETGWHAYALFSQSTLEQMNVEPEGMHYCVEQYDHLGAVPIASFNIHGRYQLLLDERQIVIHPEKADLVLTYDFDQPTAVVWDCISDMNRRGTWIPGTTWSTVLKPGGRTGNGTVNHCAHGSGVTIETIVAWKPFEYFTCYSNGGPLKFYVTQFYEPIENGTRLRASYQMDSRMPAFIRRFLMKMIMTRMYKMTDMWRNAGDMMRSLASEEIPEVATA